MKIWITDRAGEVLIIDGIINQDGLMKGAVELPASFHSRGGRYRICPKEYAVSEEEAEKKAEASIERFVRSRRKQIREINQSIAKIKSINVSDMVKNSKFVAR